MSFDVDAALARVEHANAFAHTLQRKILLFARLVRKIWLKHELREAFFLPLANFRLQLRARFVYSDESLLHSLFYSLIDLGDPFPLRYFHLFT